MDDEMPQCRYCHEGNTEEDEKMIAPCQCSGSVKYVHREVCFFAFGKKTHLRTSLVARMQCLDGWRAASANPRSFYQCDVCMFMYELEKVDGPSAISVCMFCAYVLRDFLVVMFCLNCTILALATLFLIPSANQTVQDINSDMRQGGALFLFFPLVLMIAER